MYVGVDVSKEQLDVATSEGRSFRCPNDEVGHVQLSEQLRDVHERLRHSGKPAKVALVACMRKLLVLLNTMLRTGHPWRPLSTLAA